MSALNANNPQVTSNPIAYLSIPVKGGAKIYQGARVCVVGGYATPAADTSGYTYQGISQFLADNTGGADGAINVNVTPAGLYETIAFSGTATEATVGVHVFLIDDQTVTVAGSSSNKVAFGTVVQFVSAAWVIVNTQARFTLATAA